MRGIHFRRQIVHFRTFSCTFGITRMDHQPQTLKQKLSKYSNLHKSCCWTRIKIHHACVNTCGIEVVVVCMRTHIPLLVDVPYMMSTAPATDATPLTILDPILPCNKCLTTPLDAPCRDVFMHLLVAQFEALVPLNLQDECTRRQVYQMSKKTSAG